MKIGDLSEIDLISTIKLKADKFLSHVDKTGECWIWTAGKYWDGYGKFALCFPGRKQVKIRSHRFAYMLFKGPIKKGMNILHSCDNRECCNPDHLEEGGQSKNIKDAYIRGGRSAGEGCSSATISNAQAREILRLKKNGVKASAIAKQFQITNQHVYHIGYDSWRHLR